MRNLLNFIIKYSSWFVFIIYVLISCALIVGNSSYRRSIYLTSANAVSSAVNGVSASVNGYFNLSQINKSLEQRTADLEAENLNLHEQLKEYQALSNDSAGNRVRVAERFHYILAPVISATTHHPRNYITISKGYLDGVKPGMGVVDHNGLVGVVNVSGPHTARIISLLNDAQHFSVKLKDTPFVGSLTWRGHDRKVAYLEELPRHAVYHTGDTVVTSGFSTAFPGGVPIGTVMNSVRGEDDNYVTLKVRLIPDFANMRAVRVIADAFRAEMDTLSRYDLK